MIMSTQLLQDDAHAVAKLVLSTQAKQESKLNKNKNKLLKTSKPCGCSQPLVNCVEPVQSEALRSQPRALKQSAY